MRHYHLSSVQIYQRALGTMGNSACFSVAPKYLMPGLYEKCQNISIWISYIKYIEYLISCQMYNTGFVLGGCQLEMKTFSKTSSKRVLNRYSRRRYIGDYICRISEAPIDFQYITNADILLIYLLRYIGELLIDAVNQEVDVSTRKWFIFRNRFQSHDHDPSLPSGPDILRYRYFPPVRYMACRLISNISKKKVSSIQVSHKVGKWGIPEKSIRNVAKALNLGQ